MCGICAHVVKCVEFKHVFRVCLDMYVCSCVCYTFVFVRVCTRVCKGGIQISWLEVEGAKDVIQSVRGYMARE